ncbi:hypothetical protein MSHO_18780 [Mycobacterium shottsii]|uniref:IS5 family transposase n=2 Tax=Mycobacterium shottsii TaxID=133549 RepID=A0A7I7LBA3_9MYCO|nr:IS5 family transposase [Mycobacterium shottsii]BBX56533.1 hypothetical protein MSHO_18780 [Mycobacterium shottsii]
MRTHAISDDLWSLIVAVLPAGRRRGRPWNDHRRTLEGIIWRYRTGSPWCDLPEHFGPWQSVAERHLRWSVDGIYARIFAAIASDLDAEDADLGALLSVDSTSVRAHQHAAGARPGAAQGDLSNYKKYLHEPDDHAIGHSRGGLTTKIHALTDQLCSPVTLALSAGQAGDNPMLWPLLAARCSNSYAPYRLLADKAYSHDSTRAQLRRLKIAHTIPERSDQITRRKAKGRNRGRPPGFSGRIYKHRNTVERSFNRLKHWRAVATRYDKYALTYLSGATLAAIITYHRVRN